MHESEVVSVAMHYEQVNCISKMISRDVKKDEKDKEEERDHEDFGMEE